MWLRSKSIKMPNPKTKDIKASIGICGKRASFRRTRMSLRKFRARLA